MEVSDSPEITHLFEATPRENSSTVEVSDTFEITHTQFTNSDTTADTPEADDGTQLGNPNDGLLTSNSFWKSNKRLTEFQYRKQTQEEEFIQEHTVMWIQLRDSAKSPRIVPLIPHYNAKTRVVWNNHASFLVPLRALSLFQLQVPPPLSLLWKP